MNRAVPTAEAHASKPATGAAADSSAAVPRHVAVVMDGNGRWARKRFMPRFFGHKQGVDALVQAVNIFADRGVQCLTVFAFSITLVSLT